MSADCTQYTDIELNNVCLTCLRRFDKRANGADISIFQKRLIGRDIVDISVLLSRYTCFGSFEKFPSKVCIKCVVQLENIHKFTLTCHKSKRILLDTLKMSPSDEPNAASVFNYEVPIVSANVEHQTAKTETAEQTVAKVTPKPIDRPKRGRKRSQAGTYLTANAREVKILPKSLPNQSMIILQQAAKAIQAKQNSFFKCELCPKQFISADCLKQHQMRNHVSRFCCDICSIKFSRKEDLDQHNLEQHFSAENACEMCPRRYKTMRSLELHVVKAHVKEEREDAAGEGDGNTGLRCIECSMDFENVAAYTEHQRAHETLCAVCACGFASPEQLRAHCTRHASTRPYRCASCHRGFLSRQALIRHGKAVHELMGPVFFCGLCAEVTEAYLDLASLREHLKGHGAEDHQNLRDSTIMELEYACDARAESEPPPAPPPPPAPALPPLADAPAEPAEATVLYYVIDEKNPGNLIEITEEQAKMLAGDNVETTSLENVVETSVTETADEEDIPDEADGAAESGDGSGLAATDDRAADERGRFKCDVCAFRTSKLYNVKRHMALSHKLYTIGCTRCADKFNSMVLYDIHRLTQCKFVKKPKTAAEPKAPEGGHSKRISECPICFARFKRKAPLFAHMKEQHKEVVSVNALSDKYLCRLCNKRLRTRAGFSYHMRRHFGYPRFACAECGRRFTSGAALRNHVAGQHDKLRPHLCQKCGHRFVSADHLRKHLRLTHGGRRDHLCNVCGLTFQQASHVRQHQWAHTGVKPHPCRYCAVRYSSQPALKKHYLKMHSEEYQRSLEQREKRYATMEERDRLRASSAGVAVEAAPKVASDDQNQSKDEDALFFSLEGGNIPEGSVSFVVEVGTAQDGVADNISGPVQAVLYQDVSNDQARDDVPTDVAINDSENGSQVTTSDANVGPVTNQAEDRIAGKLNRVEVNSTKTAMEDDGTKEMEVRSEELIEDVQDAKIVVGGKMLNLLDDEVKTSRLVQLLDEEFD